MGGSSGSATRSSGRMATRPASRAAAPAPETRGGMPFAEAFQAASTGRQATALVDLRERLGGTREQQDAAIRAAWASGAYTLDNAEGIAARDRDPRILSGSLYLSPRPDGRYTGPDGRKYLDRVVYIRRADD